MENIERQKIAEREALTFEEKENIAKKSGHKCCHCGKEVYYGYGATVDHFIPLSKGGTNRDINLVMLCKTCNTSKGDMILKPDDYLLYLEDESREKLNDYFKSYTQSFEYISRGNLLSCDQYKLYVETKCDSHRARRNTDRGIGPLNNYVILKRATVDDIPKLVDYFEAYVKKYDCFKDRDTVDLNIRFWFQFGCIYYIESIEGIKVMAALTVTRIDSMLPRDEPEYALSMSLFAYYDTSQALTLCHGMMECIPRLVMKEQGVKQLPVRLNMLKADKVSATILTDGGKDAMPDSDEIMAHQYLDMYIEKEENRHKLPKMYEDEDLLAFFNKFSNVEDEVKRWLGDNENMAWMLKDIKIGF